MIAFCVSCAICGLAGSLYGTFSQLVSPELGLLQQTGLILSMVVIGGMGSLTGSILGAVLIYLGSEWLRGFGNIQLIVFALLVILFARYIPGGLWGWIAAQAAGEGAMSLLTIEGLFVHFGGVAAVDNVSFDVAAGRDPGPDRAERFGQDHGAEPAVRLSRAARRAGAHARRGRHRHVARPAGPARRAADVPDDPRLHPHVGLRQPAHRRHGARACRRPSPPGAPMPWSRS